MNNQAHTHTLPEIRELANSTIADCDAQSLLSAPEYNFFKSFRSYIKDDARKEAEREIEDTRQHPRRAALTAAAAGLKKYGWELTHQSRARGEGIQTSRYFRKTFDGDTVVVRVSCHYLPDRPDRQGWDCEIIIDDYATPLTATRINRLAVRAVRSESVRIREAIFYTNPRLYWTAFGRRT